MITLTQGAQRYITFTPSINGYAQCSQIIVEIKKISDGIVAKEFWKVPDDEEKQGTVESVPGYTKKFRIFLLEALTKTLSGDYNVIVTQKVEGEKMPINITIFEKYLTVNAK